MLLFIVTRIFSLLLTLMRIGRMSDNDKDLEILAWFKTMIKHLYN